MINLYKPFDYQQEAIDAIFDYFRSNKGNPLVVAPTGSGKSVIIAEFTRIVKSWWPNQKILILSHDMEILSQDHKAVSRQNPDLEIGLYSAGLKSKVIKDITVAGIQSVYKQPDLFTDFNIVLLDEAHTVRYDNDSMYMKFLKALGKPVIGFTATPFRLGTGYLHLGDKAFFDDIIYTIKIKTLQDQGKLCKITNKQPGITMDASAIKKQAGDFIIKELSMAFDKEAITAEIVQDLALYKDVREKWLVYAIDIEHCEHIAEKLNEVGVKSEAIHSKTGLARGPIIDKFKQGQYQALVSVAMLTTGVDIPEVDMIVLMRPTASPVLHVQIIGRGMRVAEGKEDCLVRDYAGNLQRNGPIDAPVIKLAGDGNGQPIMKVCEECDEIVHIAVRTCPACGTEFIFKHNLTSMAAGGEVISRELWYPVTGIYYDYYVGGRGRPMLLVTHVCGITSFKKYVPIEHGGRATYQAKHWWKRRTDQPFPRTASEALDIATAGGLNSPKRILVDTRGKYPEIKDVEF